MKFKKKRKKIFKYLACKMMQEIGKKNGGGGYEIKEKTGEEKREFY